ncbi:MAG: alpha/beta hydrolase [Pseudomonadota bacterium]
MDWDTAYDNSAAIENATHFPPKWHALAARFRDQLGERARNAIPYGETSRERFDLFLPAGQPQGLLVFVHGGYWHKFDRDIWSWVAAGAVARGWAVAIPGYTLCPDIRLTGIGRQIGAAITAAASLVTGPIRLSGHSAGGHLVARMLCAGALPPDVARRIAGTVAISGLPDLHPLMQTQMNRLLHITPEEAARESPVMLIPIIRAPVTCWVGNDELPEFVRQNTLLEKWRDSGLSVEIVQSPGHNHFTVIEPMQNPQSPLVAALVSTASPA